MAKGTSAKKAARQAEAERLANRSVRRRVKTFNRRAEEATVKRDAEAAPAAVKQAIRTLDKAAARGHLHRNNVARRKSRLMKKANASAQAP